MATTRTRKPRAAKGGQTKAATVDMPWIAPDLRALARPLTALTPDPKNSRLHGDLNLASITASLRAHGQRKPIVVKDGVVLAGNGTLTAARTLGWTHIACVEYEGPEALARAFCVADNRSAELATWDDQVLAAALREADGAGLLEATGFARSDADAILAAASAKTGEDPGPGPVPKTPKSKLGEIYALGAHRLRCGDSTDEEGVKALFAGAKASLVYADPPYGMKLDPRYDSMHSGKDHRKTGDRFGAVIGDDKPFDARPMLALWAAPERFMWGADYYRNTLPEGGSWVVWDKRANDAGMNLDKVVGGAFELCWSEKAHRREIARVLWSGHHGMQHEDSKKRLHPTQKPVELAEWFLERFSKIGDVVADPFAGSGPTLIACAKARRVFVGGELDPAYVDVIRIRWTKWAKSAGVDPGTGALE